MISHLFWFGSVTWLKVYQGVASLSPSACWDGLQMCNRKQENLSTRMFVIRYAFTNLFPMKSLKMFERCVYIFVCFLNLPLFVKVPYFCYVVYNPGVRS